LYKTLLSLSVALHVSLVHTFDPSAPVDCTQVGGDCTHGETCCPFPVAGRGDATKCEAVNQYYAKCVSQPTCALAGDECAGTGDTVMEPTPCCDKDFVCHKVDQYYSKCINGSQPFCVAVGEECTAGGDACCPFPTSGGRGNLTKCEQVQSQPALSKCVSQPTCTLANEQCAGTGQSVMEPTPCCDGSFVCHAVNQWYSQCVNSSASNLTQAALDHPTKALLQSLKPVAKSKA